MVAGERRQRGKTQRSRGRGREREVQRDRMRERESKRVKEKDSFSELRVRAYTRAYASTLPRKEKRRVDAESGKQSRKRETRLDLGKEETAEKQILPG